MGFMKSKKSAIISDYFRMLEPVGNYEAGNMYDVALHEDHLEVSTPTKKNKILLPYSRITDVFYGYNTDLITKEKSVIGRAAIGGLLFGGVGAIVGAVSATVGDKQVKDKRLYLIISYRSDTGDGYLQFEDTRHWHGKKVADTLKELCGFPTEGPQPVQDIQL